MKALLLDPPHRIHGALRMWTPSPGLMALVGYLEAKGKEVDLLDATTLRRPWTDLARIIKENRYDLVGVTCSQATFHHEGIMAARLVRRVLPEAFIAGGGGHFTLNAERILEEAPEFDSLVLGEGEETLLDLLELLESSTRKGLSTVSGLAYREGPEIVFTGPRPMIRELDTLPMPAYHRVDMEHPMYYLHGMGRRAVGISTSRGCGDRCTYCSEAALWRSTWRGRSGPLVVEEMKRLHQDYGKSLFVFNENSFNQSRERNEAFLDALGRSGLRCHFWFQSRIKDILRDRDLLGDFKRLGCYEVMLGVESISPQALKSYAKHQTLEQTKEATALLRENGIMVMTNIMFGDWEDTEGTLEEIYRLVIRIGEFLVLTITTPLPGTHYFDQALKAGRIEEQDFARYDFMHAIMRNQRYTRDEIQALQKKYLKKYYTRPTVFLKMCFSSNPFLRMAYRLIMRYAWYEARAREWVQPNYEDPPLDLREDSYGARQEIGVCR